MEPSRWCSNRDTSWKPLRGNPEIAVLAVRTPKVQCGHQGAIPVPRWRLIRGRAQPFLPPTSVPQEGASQCERALWKTQPQNGQGPDLSCTPYRSFPRGPRFGRTSAGLFGNHPRTHPLERTLHPLAAAVHGHGHNRSAPSHCFLSSGEVDRFTQASAAL